MNNAKREAAVTDAVMNQDEEAAVGEQLKEESSTFTFPEDKGSLLHTERLGTVLNYTGTFVAELAKRTSTFIKGDFSFVVSPYAAWGLRTVALFIALLSLFNPVLETGGTGLIGWIQDVLANLVLAFGLFVIAEVMLVQADIAKALNSLTRIGQQEEARHG